METFQTLAYEKTDGLGVITLNRPKQANGINTVLAQELAELAALCVKDKTLKAIILTGNGSFFCAVMCP